MSPHPLAALVGAKLLAERSERHVRELAVSAPEHRLPPPERKRLARVRALGWRLRATGAR
jgi:hypothetical protein